MQFSDELGEGQSGCFYAVTPHFNQNINVGENTGVPVNGTDSSFL